MIDSSTVTIEPSVKHTHTVILIHGRGSNAREFREDFFESSCQDGRGLEDHFPTIRWVLPSAPSRYSTVFQEELMEWFDVYSLADPNQRQDLQKEGITASIIQIKEVIRKELLDVPSQHLFIGGISQGCAIAVMTLLATELCPAGLIGIAGWMPFSDLIQDILKLHDRDEQQVQLTGLFGRLFGQFEPPGVVEHIVSRSARSLQRTPAILCHGSNDGVVDIALGHKLRDVLLGLGLTLDWQEYGDCGHWIKEPDGVDAIAAFLRHYMKPGSENIA